MKIDLGYIALSTMITLVLILFGSLTIKRSFNDPVKVKKKIILLAFFLIIWHIYVYVVALTEIPQDFSLPPKGPLLFVLPPFLFTGVFLYMNRNNNWIRMVPMHWLVYFQSFRILIESLFVVSVSQKLLHPNMTIEGYNFDMIFAFTAPIIGFLIHKYGNRMIKYVKLWNYLCLIVIASILFLVFTTTYLSEFYGSKTALMPKAFGMYTFVLVAALLMPPAVFMHVLSLVQLRERKVS